jgi:hypothetical protein
MRIREHTRALFLTTCFSSVLMLGPTVGGATADKVSNWNVTAVTATAMAGQNAVVQSRSLAMVQAAIHDALNAIDRRFEPYALEGVLDALASPDAAVAAAAHDTLVGLIPVGALPFVGFGSVAQQTAAITFANAAYTSDLGTIPDGEAKTRGIAVGHAAAQAILTRRLGDGATTFVPYTPGTTGSPRRIPCRSILRLQPTACLRPFPGGGTSRRSCCARAISSRPTALPRSRAIATQLTTTR